MTFWTVSASLRSSSSVRPFWTSIRTSGMSLLSVAGCQRRGIRSGAVHACRSGVDEVRSVVLTEVVLQFLEGAATSLWAELPGKQERDRINEGEQAEGQRRTQRPNQQREDEGDDRVRGPENEHGGAHREATDCHWEDF